MYIKLSPQLNSERLLASRTGDVLTLNGVEFDFSQLPEGGVLPSDAIDSEWFSLLSTVSRIDGELHLTLRLPHGPNPSRAVAFPEPIHVTQDGPILLPFDPEPEPEVIEEPAVEVTP